MTDSKKQEALAEVIKKVHPLDLTTRQSRLMAIALMKLEQSLDIEDKD